MHQKKRNRVIALLCSQAEREKSSGASFSDKLSFDNKPVLSLNAKQVLEKRYLLKDRHSEIIETPYLLFRRVSREIAAAEKKYDKTEEEINNLEREFFDMLANLEFLPNSPTLMNAGTKLGQLSACFVLPIEDSIESIFTALKEMAIIHQSGGGTGFSFSKLRPKGDVIESTKCHSSGPVSFIQIFDSATNVIKQGGKRRGANMGVLRMDHPDILEFITAKNNRERFGNFNLSVAVTDEFMRLAAKGSDYSLINPRNGSASGRLNAALVLKEMAKSAWQTGDPGIIFIDEVNRHNPTPAAGKIEATNPCAEQPLLSYESCNLGSINLSKFVLPERKIDWAKLKKTVWLGVHFLDNVIDVNRFPVREVEEKTKSNRKIGLGVMGFADMLVKLRIPYDSGKAERLAQKIMRFISKEARRESQRLAKERGNFPNFSKSKLAKKFSRMRNATLTTIAPTGTISIIAGCSSGIEPLFGISFTRNVLDGQRLPEVNEEFKELAEKKGFYSDRLLQETAKTGSVQHIKEISSDIKKIFVTAHDIKPEWHVRIQAAFQKYTDSGVSKTINLPESATPDDIIRIFKLAHKLRCKGITVYRYRSREGQVLNFENEKDVENKKHKKELMVSPEYAGGCPAKECSF
jgi:ribonucleoside-diphosphate reductase alpha chain